MELDIMKENILKLNDAEDCKRDFSFVVWKGLWHWIQRICIGSWKEYRIMVQIIGNGGKE